MIKDKVCKGAGPYCCGPREYKIVNTFGISKLEESSLFTLRTDKKAFEDRTINF